MTWRCDGDQKITQSLLYLDGVSVSFDGFRAINNLSLEIAPGEMRAIIGPNGAGKTTMMDIITGKTRPDKGDVLFCRRHGRSDQARRSGDRQPRHRTQVPEADRLRAAHGRGQSAAVAEGGSRRPADAVLALFARATCRRIDEILAVTKLGPHRHRHAGALSHGQKQWLEIGMLLGQDPKLLLVDEPVAGMTDAETGADRRAAAVISPRTTRWSSSSTTWISCARSVSASPFCTRARFWPRGRSIM